MARTCLTLLLLLSVAYGQLTTERMDVPDKESVRTVHGLRSSSSLEYDGLRQGTDEYAEILLYGEGRFAIASPGRQDHRLVPSQIEIQLHPGLHISPIRYRDGHQRQFAFDSKPVRVLEYPEDRDRGVIVFKVRADPDIPPGEYKLQASLQVQVVNDYGISEPLPLGTDIPITVVNRKARVNSLDRGIGGIRGIKPEEWVAIVLLAPVTVPLGIVMLLIGWDGC